MPTLNFSEIVSSLQSRQNTIKQEQDSLLQKNQECSEEAQDISGAELKSKYSEVVSQDKGNIQQFNEAIKTHKPVVEGEYPVTTNKMNVILDGLDPLNEDDEVTVKYDNTISTSSALPTLGNNEFWGSSSSIFHTATLLYRLRAITGESFVQIMPMYSSVFHIAPLTKGLLSCLDGSLLVSGQQQSKKLYYLRPKY